MCFLFDILREARFSPFNMYLLTSGAYSAKSFSRHFMCSFSKQNTVLDAPCCFQGFISVKQFGPHRSPAPCTLRSSHHSLFVPNRASEFCPKLRRHSVSGPGGGVRVCVSARPSCGHWGSRHVNFGEGYATRKGPKLCLVGSGSFLQRAK